MNRAFLIAALGVGLMVVGFVRVEAAGGSSLKVGYVDLQRTLNETKAGKAAKSRLERNKKKKQRELDRKQKELQKLAADLEKQRAVLKPAALERKQRELQEKYVKLQEVYVKLQQDLAKEEAKLVREIFKKAQPAIKSIAKQKGFTMILEKNEGAVLWADSALDITNQVNAKVR